MTPTTTSSFSTRNWPLLRCAHRPLRIRVAHTAIRLGLGLPRKWPPKEGSIPSSTPGWGGGGVTITNGQRAAGGDKNGAGLHFQHRLDGRSRPPIAETAEPRRERRQWQLELVGLRGEAAGRQQAVRRDAPPPTGRWAGSRLAALALVGV
jgi:hypothetical protein